MSLETIAAELYGLPLDEFVAARDQHSANARKEKDRTLANALKALAKPSVGAWAVNQIVRKSRHTVERLLDVGDSMREAQLHLDGDAMRQLTAERRRLLAELTEDLRGLQISDAAENEALESLNAAVAEADLAAQLRLGQLTRPLHHSGFGGMESMLASSLFATPPNKSEPEPAIQPSAPAEVGSPQPDDELPSPEPTPAAESKSQPETAPPTEPLAPEPIQSNAPRRDEKSPQLKRLQRRLELAQETLEEAKSDRDLAGERVDSLRERLQAAKDKLKEADQAVRTAEEECEDLQEQIDDL
ncbi:MAG: hypothetical protein J0I12_16270 [Candidatus Eremiobacteraeota bacterium]|nr:hypothetical protein [Candidatus Eremiobacteraeota bacterium]